MHTHSQDLQKYSVQRHAINKATLSGSLQTGISLEFIEFTMSETAAEMPARFIAAVYLLPNTEQNFSEVSGHLPVPGYISDTCPTL